MKRAIFVFAVVWTAVGVAGLCGQGLKKENFPHAQSPASGLQSNAVNSVVIAGNNVWVGTGKELLRTADNGETWIRYSRTDSLGKGGVSALAVRGDTIWVATAFDTTIASIGTLSAGGGLSCSIDNGETWHWIPQPVDSKEETDYSPTTTNVYNVTYDIALVDTVVWIASWAGGLRKSSDMGKTWKVVTVDGLPFHVSNNNFIHMAFSVFYDGEALWAGSAAGIHRSTDGGLTWTTFNHQNQVQGISGNHVVAVGCQHIGEKKIIWASTLEAVDESEVRAVSKTEDGGLTWTVMLEGVRTWNFAFDGSVVYAATDLGLYKSMDFGASWYAFLPIVDSETGEGMYTTEMIDVDVRGDTLWVGSEDGLARSFDNGFTWKIFRAFRVPGVDRTPQTYAYPNPFSPLRHNLLGGDGYVRFQYRTTRPTKVAVRVYDFGMNLVRTVTEGKDRSIAGDYAEMWNGRNDVGDMVANGVYFYKVSLSSGESFWGKVMVVN